MEYVEREAIKYEQWPVGPLYEPIMVVRKKTIDNIPAADVAPVRHAKWEVVVGSDGKEHMVCTGCRKQQDLTGVFTYCPNCGAKMDLKGE